MQRIECCKVATFTKGIWVDKVILTEVIMQCPSNLQGSEARLVFKVFITSSGCSMRDNLKTYSMSPALGTAEVIEKSDNLSRAWVSVFRAQHFRVHRPWTKSSSPAVRQEAKRQNPEPETPATAKHRDPIILSGAYSAGVGSSRHPRQTKWTPLADPETILLNWLYRLVASLALVCAQSIQRRVFPLRWTPLIPMRSALWTLLHSTLWRQEQYQALLRLIEELRNPAALVRVIGQQEGTTNSQKRHFWKQGLFKQPFRCTSVLASYIRMLQKKINFKMKTTRQIERSFWSIGTKHNQHKQSLQQQQPEHQQTQQ